MPRAFPTLPPADKEDEDEEDEEESGAVVGAEVAGGRRGGAHHGAAAASHGGHRSTEAWWHEDDAPRTTVPVPRAMVGTTTAAPAAASLHAGTHRASAPPLVPQPPRPFLPEAPPVPAPLRHARFDNPYRVLALLEAGGTAAAAELYTLGPAADTAADDVAADAAAPPPSPPPAHPLSKPRLNSTARLASSQNALSERTFEAHALPQVHLEVARRARREATPELNTPIAKADRYQDLTSLEPSTAPGTAPGASGLRTRHRARFAEEQHSAWRSMRALEPALDELFTRDREVEVMDTRRDAALPWPHMTAEAQVALPVRVNALSGHGAWSDAFRSPLRAAGRLCEFTPGSLRLGEQRALTG